MKLAQEGLSLEFRKKLDGIPFHDTLELAESVIQYEDMLKEESRHRHRAFNAYEVSGPFEYHDKETYEVDVAEFVRGQPF